MSVENHIIKVSFCGTFQKAVKPKRYEISGHQTKKEKFIIKKNETLIESSTMAATTNFKYSFTSL